MSTKKIVSGVIDTKRLLLVTDKGEEITINQGDIRLRPLIDFITEPMQTIGFVDVPDEMFQLPNQEDQHLPYAEYEEKSGGVVKFFRVAKKMLKKFLGSGDRESKNAAERELVNEDLVPSRTFGGSTAHVTKAAVEEIMAAGVPAADPAFQSETVKRQENVIDENGLTPSDKSSKAGTLNETDTPDTIVAVVTDPKTKKTVVVPGMEKIESQVKRANKNENTIGVTNLLSRLGAIIEQRGHTSDDVLRFLQRADMSVADNGDIIALKVLTTRGAKFEGLGAPEDQFADCHTSKVHQWVGAKVEMEISLVDRNRGQECSAGLHIARRGYLHNGFSGGDVCVVTIIRPEDFIAVPLYDANKVRVSAYHIVARLTNDQKAEVFANRPFTTKDGGDVLLANLMKGNYAPATHTVHIGGGYGTKLSVTRSDGMSQKAYDEAMAAASAGSVVVDTPVVEQDASIAEEALPDHVVKPVPIDTPVTMDAIKEKLAPLTRAQQAKDLYDKWVTLVMRESQDPDDVIDGDDKEMFNAYDKLLEFKKAAKVGWDKLGIPNNGKNPITPHALKQRLAQTVSAVATKNKTAPIKKTIKPKVAAKAPEKPVGAFKKPATTKPTTKEKKPMTPRQELEVVLKDKTPETITKAIAEKAQEIKKFAKKGWGVLGVSPEMERAIMKHVNKGKW